MEREATRPRSQVTELGLKAGLLSPLCGVCTLPLAASHLPHGAGPHTPIPHYCPESTRWALGSLPGGTQQQQVAGWAGQCGQSPSPSPFLDARPWARTAAGQCQVLSRAPVHLLSGKPIVESVLIIITPLISQMRKRRHRESLSD